MIKNLCLFSIGLISFGLGITINKKVEDNSTMLDIIKSDRYSAIQECKNKVAQYSILYSSTCMSKVLKSDNISQSKTKDLYNLDPYDLNGDGIINYSDRIGNDGGCCQTIATLGNYVYLHNNSGLYYNYPTRNDLYRANIKNYISIGWKGNGSERSNSKKTMNMFYDQHKYSLNANYDTVNILSKFNKEVEKNRTAVLHLESGNGEGHAVVGCGTVEIVVKYKKGKFITYTEKNTYYTINDGWRNCISDKDENYSYVHEKYVKAMTRTC